MLVSCVWMSLANVFDVVSTKVGLERGLKEANPFARQMIETYGFQATAAYKLATPLIFLPLAMLAEHPKAKAYYGMMFCAMGIIFAIASINNIMLISLKKSASVSS